jgi:hypothetical protein
LDILLQLWGGIFYLLAKVFLSRAEEKNSNQNRVIGWFVYLLGVPAWVVVLYKSHNWIAMAIEVGGVPAMILGIVVSIKKLEHAPELPDKCTKVFVWVLMTSGVFYSILDFGGITSLSQVLECGVTVGFLTGTYLLAKKDPRGWLYFLLMNGSMLILMARQEKWIFVLLQAASIFFAVRGFKKAKMAANTKHS